MGERKGLRRVPRLDTQVTLFGMPVGAVLTSVFGGLIALQIVQVLISNLFVRGVVSLLAVFVLYRGSLWFSDNYGNGFGMRFIRFLTSADFYAPSEPQKEIPLTLSRAGLPDSGERAEKTQVEEEVEVVPV